MSSRRMIVTMALAGLAAATTGCVSREEYEQARAASRRAHLQLKQCEGALQTARQDNQSLRADLAARDTALDGKDKIIGNLEQANADWKDKFDKLTVLYQNATKQPPPIVGPIRILPAKLDAALRALARQNSDLMEYLPNYGMIKLKADLTFAKGSADVSNKATGALEKLAGLLGAGEGKAFHVYVAGHTDDIPLRKAATIAKHGSNWGLSLHRAGAVVKVLALAGLEQRRMGAMGFSKYHPVADNASDQKGNPVNRRVEIWIVPPDRFLTSSGAAASEK